MQSLWENKAKGLLTTYFYLKYICMEATKAFNYTPILGR